MTYDPDQPAEHPEDSQEHSDTDESAFTTGDTSVDAAVARLDELDERDLDEHLALYEDVHERLRTALDGTSES